MKTMSFFRSLLLASALIGGLSVTPAQATEAEKVIAAAETAQQKAASVGGEWRDTGKIIKQAKAAAKAGDEAKALQLAETAKQQGELGYAQAMAEKDAGFPSYLQKYLKN